MFSSSSLTTPDSDESFASEINDELLVFLDKIGSITAATNITCAEEKVMDQITDGGKVLTKCRALTLLGVFVGFTFFIGLMSYLLSPAPSAPAPDTPTKKYLTIPVPDLSFPTVFSDSSSASGKKTELSVTKNVRLPRALLPSHYEIRLFPILEKGNLSNLGYVSIDLECKEETDRVVLHAKELTIDPKNVKLFNRSNMESIAIGKVEFDAVLDFLIIQLSTDSETKLERGKNYTLSMSFVGNLTDGLSGLYRSSYIEHGVQKYLITSQMEPTDARRVFPCFDEPNMKAVFTVSLGRRRDMVTLSNMPQTHSTPMDELDEFYWDHYSPTLPMSTYLLAFVVTQDFTRLPSVKGVFKWNFTTYARPSATRQLKYASEIGPIILKFYEDFFQKPYPLPKQDLIAIPDFAAEAMENWGLITFNEEFLLYDEESSSLEEKEQVVLTIAHELAHQWFGNLVTIDWWTDLWLNEGFATFIEYIGADYAEPHFQFTQQIVTDSLQKAMSYDTLVYSHPINVQVNFPEEINEIFDTISYQKGAAVIRMLRSIVGEEAFTNALSYYINTYQYENAVQDNLWDAFEKQAKEDGVKMPTSVKIIMDSWTLQTGFPVVTVNRSEMAITITQERFLLDKTSPFSKEASNNLWWIFLTYTTDFISNESTWLTANESIKTIIPEVLIRGDQWIIFNVDETGFYRVNYDLHNWKLIDRQLKENHNAISSVNRAQILDDSFNLARANLLDYEVPLTLLIYMKNETDHLPWTPMLESLAYIDSMMWQKSTYGLLKDYLKAIIAPVFSSLGLEPKKNEPYSTQKLRILLGKWACYYGNQQCVRQATELYRRWMADPNNMTVIPVDTKSIVISTAIREGGEKEWNSALIRYTKSDKVNEKELLLFAMASTRELFLLDRMLEMTLSSSSGIRTQDGPKVICAISKNNFGRSMTFSFMKENWEKIITKFSSFNIPEIVQTTAASLNTQSHLREFKEFHEEHPSLNSVIRSVQQSIDRITNNIAWMAHNYPKVASWLQRK